MANETRRSWLGFFFPYVGMLEAQNAALRSELEGEKTRAERLLDRIVKITTGFGLNETIPEALAEQARPQPVNPYELLKQMERESLEAYEARLRKKSGPELGAQTGGNKPNGN